MSSVQLYPQLNSVFTSDFVLLKVCKSLDTSLAKMTFVTVILSVAHNNALLEEGRPYAVVQLRTNFSQFFYTVYVSNEFSPLETVSSSPTEQDVNFTVKCNILQETLKEAANVCGCQNVTSLVAKAVNTSPAGSSFLRNAFTFPW